jgi:hypothetical protein
MNDGDKASRLQAFDFRLLLDVGHVFPRWHVAIPLVAYFEIRVADFGQYLLIKRHTIFVMLDWCAQAPGTQTACLEASPTTPGQMGFVVAVPVFSRTNGVCSSCPPGSFFK